MARARVFLSAVSSEFGLARDALANDLQSRDVTVRVQRSFRYDHEADTLLHKLHNYIKGCTTVVCLIGSRSGAGFPTPAEAAPFAEFLPVGITEASYTQWEFFFAHRLIPRSLLVYFSTDKFVPPDVSQAPAEDRPALQAVFAGYVRSLGRQWAPVDNRDAFRAEAFKDLIAPAERADKLIALPYPSLGTLFKGRDAFMQRLRASLTRADGGTAAIAGRVVHGLGGVGKTRAAVEYAWAHRADYCALVLLDAETGDKLHAGLAALTGLLRLEDAATKDEAARMEAALAWLNTNPGWLLILDNVDTDLAMAAANRLLGRLHGGHVVLTSRLAAGFARGVERLDLDLLTPDDAAAFLLEATDSSRPKAPDDATQARALAAEDLGQLALALEMAAATIEARGLGFAAYRALWQGNRKRVVGWAGERMTGYHHAVAETWRTSVDQLTEAGRHLLERLAFLAPNPVPGFLLDVAVPGPVAEDPAAALDNLAAYSLVTRDVDSGTFLVHRLVQDVTRRGLEAAGTTTERLTEALGWVNAAFSGNASDVRTWPTLDKLAPHAEAVVGHADAAGIADPSGRLMNELGTLSHAKAVYARAEPLFRRALAIDEASLGKDHPEVATALNNLAGLLHATNRLGEAEPLYRRALGIDEASLGKDHPNVATHLNNLAGLLSATNRLGEAEPLYRRALAIDEASYDKDHPDVATDLNNLAGLLRATNRLGEAEPLFRRALVIDEASLGKDHPNVARDLNNLAELLHATNRLGEAEPLYRRALAIDEASLGKDHPNVAIRLNNLAELLRATNRLGEAEPLYRRALAIHEASLGKDHPTVATDLNNLAGLLRATNRLGEAEPLYRRALAISEASLGKDHPTVAIRLNNVAGLLRDTNLLGEAEPLYRRALAIFLALERAIGREHPSRVTVQENYESLLAEMGNSPAEIASAIAALRQEAGLDRA